MSSTDKSLKKIIFLGGALLIALSVLSIISHTTQENSLNGGEEEKLTALLSEIEGVESVNAAFSYSEGGRISGIAVVYRGPSSALTVRRMYELINSLYGIPYSRIYVSAQS